MDKETALLVLGALLHDIGKLMQRAGRPKSNQESEYCRTGKNNQFTHQHTLYTDAFIENKSIFPLPDELEPLRSKLARLAASHHKPAEDSLLEKSLQIADGLSAGIDRENEPERRGNFKTDRLISGFQQVSLNTEIKSDALEKGMRYGLNAIEENAFPVSGEEAQETTYQRLCSEFEQELQRLPLTEGINQYIEALSSLLEKYTWCIPSSTFKSLPDISLYDHSTTTAAIAQCLHKYHKNNRNLPEHHQSENKFILLGGDLSGIQSYIFNVEKSHGSGVAKLFRARSFYLGALTRSVILNLAQKLGLSTLLRIMDAGGRFILLLPNTKEVADFLPEFERQVQEWFYLAFQGRLSLNLDYSVTLTQQDFKLRSFQIKLDQFNQSLEERKQHKFNLLFEKGINAVQDLNFDDYQETGVCSVCQSQPGDAELSKKYAERHQLETSQDSIGFTICKQCWQQIELIGKNLPQANWLVTKTKPGNQDIPLFGGLGMYLAKGDKPSFTPNTLEIVSLRHRGLGPYMPLAGHMPLISEQDLERWHEWKIINKNDQGAYFFQYEELEPEMPKTFNLLAQESRQPFEQGNQEKLLGRSFLGVFKADVDNLGMIFSMGLGDRLSVSRFVSLSRMLNHFFTEYLTNELVKENYSDTYIIFSGGDDLFLLGPWHQTIRLAVELSKKFREYVCHNQSITLSAGICVAKPGLPVHTLADMAEEHLEKSKKYKTNDSIVKNSVTLFETTVQWNKFEYLIKKGDWLFDLIIKQTIPMGLASRLLYYSRQKAKFDQGEIEYGIYKSHMRYDFTRNIQEKDMEPKKYKEIMDLQNNEDLLKMITLPVSFALYRIRQD
jgi:CRISPR-associated protein Csm1